jgi:hypothetical protein
LEDAATVAEWQEAAPEGLDLEYCMHRPQLRARLDHCGAPKLRMILGDNSTKVASEGTCLAVAMSCIDDTEEWSALLRLVHWQWLPRSSIWYAAKGVWCSAETVQLLSLVALLDESERGRVLREQSRPNSIVRPSALLPRRPASRMTELQLPWEVSVEDLRGNFGTTTNLIPAPQQLLFSGFQWSVQLQWTKDSADPTLWKLAAVVDANVGSGEAPPAQCMLSICCALYVNDSLVTTKRPCWDCSAEKLSLLPVVVPKVSMWPASGIAHFGLEGAVLRGKVVVQQVM